MMNRVMKIILLLAILALPLSACSQANTHQPVTIRLALLPILDTLPLYVAEQEGIFAEQGVKVEFIPAGSAAERDQMISAGQADGMINETIATMLYNRDSIQVQIVRFARRATPTFPQYRLLASAQSGITTPDGLRGVEIGVSQGTIIEYITQRLLEAEGLSSSDIKTIAVPNIADRMQLLASGELQAATLPDPLSTLAIQSGAVVVVDDTTHPEYGYSTYAFRADFIAQNPDAVRAFLAAVDDAISRINSNPTAWDTLLTEQKLVPAPLIGSYEIPAFPEASVPSQAQWDDAMAWVMEKGLISAEVSYTDSVTSEYLP